MDLTQRDKMEVAVIAMSPEEEAVLGKQHELYQEDAAAQRSSSSSSSSSSPLLQQPDFLAANAAAIEVNSGDYTCWYLRRRFLSLNPKYLNRDELSYCRYMCSINLKNYQCWFHRRWILEHITTVSFSLQEETDSVKETLAADSKNYNSWAHRVFLVRRFGLSLSEELRDTERFLLTDVYNNSAYSYIFFLTKQIAQQQKQQQQQQQQQQEQQQQQQQQPLSTWTQTIMRHLPAFEQHPTNESLVAFLLGCLKEAAAAARQQKQQQKQQQQQQQQQEQQQQEQQDEEHPKELREVIEALLSAAARVAAAAAAAGGAARLGLEVGVAVDELRGDYKAAHKKCLLLQTQDPIRRFYWSWRAINLDKKATAMRILS